MSLRRSPTRARAARLVAVAVGSVIVGTGCGSDDQSDVAAERPTRTPSAATATPTPQAPPAGRTLRFRATDGTRLQGTLTPGPADNAPALVLVHQVDGGPDQWDEFIPYLHEAGYATLAYRSRGSNQLDETLLSRDIAGAVSALRRQEGIDSKRLGVIGASIGATATSWFAGTSQAHGVGAFVALSPVVFDAPPRRYRPNGLLLIADKEEVSMAEEIADAAATDVKVTTTAVYGHGISLLPHEKVRETVLNWLNRHLR